MIVTVQECLDYMGYDFTDEMIERNITRAINTADSILRGSIGDLYPTDDPRAKELALIIVQDLIDDRGYTLSTSASNNVRRLVDDMSMQLRLEMRRNSGK